MLKVAFLTLGCKVNQADTASMELLFRKAGHAIVPFTDDSADVYIVNTCVVTNTGQQKSRQMVHRATRKNDKAVVAVAGCYPQTAQDEVKAIAGVDLILGTQDRHRIVSLVEAAVARKRGGEPARQDDEVRPWDGQVLFEEMAGGNEEDKTRAYLKIEEGCNQYCAYCIIPYARGPVRSRSLESIRAEVEKLTAAGYQEVVLIGIHLGCYGQDRKDGTTLYDAAKAALSVPALQRLRLGSLESVEVEPRLLDLMSRDKRFCPHLHLPLQSGCDKVLQDMHRPYDTAKFASLLQDIRAKVPGIAITTDVIVGFPGETDEDFAKTYEFARQCGFAKMHIFPYSMRHGTPAAARKDQVPEAVKKARAEKLGVLDKEMQQAYFAANVGRTVQVLAEQPVRKEKPSDPDRMEGLSENYVRVEFPGTADLARTIVPVRIVAAGVDKCEGERL
ncbi:MAG: tRNA (N(6)-L-threonylcarbamoyladenosine(37)-C(2))-methylthiotransferase MtaB [Succiniclasticum sp.]|jgi:threonylcarbamoyladenosine tRNA methylthiotransferase MtaB